MGTGRVGATGASSAYAAGSDNYYPVAVVQAGQNTLAQVADSLRKQGVSVDLETLQKLNPHITDSTNLQPGQVIRLPLAAGENLPMIEGISEPPATASPSGAPALPSDDPTNKAIVQSQLAYGAQTSGGATGVTAGGSATAATALTVKSAFTGVRLGTNQSGQEVRVAREVGSGHGYDDKLQAIAVARLAGADPAVVMQDKGNPAKWHALVTTAPADGAIPSVQALPSSAPIANLKNEVVSLKAQLRKLDDQIGQINRNGGTVPKNLEQQRQKVVDDLTRDYRQLAPLVFGVPATEIQFNRSPKDDVPGKINIDPGGPGDPLGIEHLNTFQPGSTPAFSVKLDALERPDQAVGVLFHEVSHLKDNELAQQWVAAYRTQKTRFPDTPEGLKDLQTWMQSPKGRKDFTDWIHAQPAKQLSKADAELILNLTDKPTLDYSTQARAYVHAALAGLQSGAPDVAAEQLRTYAASMKEGKTANPPTGSYVQAAIEDELRSAYRQMPKPVQQQMETAIAEAKKANPDAWISHFKFPQ